MSDKETPNSKRGPFDSEAIKCGRCDSDIADNVHDNPELLEGECL